MRFSVAIPVFGQAEFLPSALRSLRAQGPDVQVAVMDATPDDSVEDVLGEYRELLSYHRHGSDDGQSAAIQEGWDATDGDVVAWLCADDYYFPNALNAVREVFERHPDIDVVHGDSAFVDEAGRFLGYFPGAGADVSRIARANSISQPSCFVRRRALEAIGGLDTRLHYIMDWDLWTRLHRAGARFRFLGEPLSVVRMHRATKTASGARRRYVEIAAHVRRHAGVTAAAASVLGFYHQSLRAGEVRGAQRWLLPGLDALSRARHAGRTWAGGTAAVKYGLSCRDRCVRGRMDIFLPWYQDGPPTELHLEADSPALDVWLNGRTLSPTDGVSPRFALPESATSGNTLHAGNTLHVRVEARDGRPWTFHRASVT